MDIRTLDTNIPSKEIHLCSDTGHQLFGDKSDYIFDIESHIRCPPNITMTVKVSKAEFPVSFYNINETNNVFRFRYKDLSIERVIVFDVGNYNVNQFLSHLNDKLQALTFTDVVINWSSLSNKLSLQCASEFRISSQSTCLSLLGFTDKDHVSDGSHKITGDSMIDIRGHTSIYINTDLMNETYTFSGKGHQTNHCLARLPVNGGAYGTITYQPIQCLSVPVKRNNISRFRIWIYDQNNNYIDFNQMKWTMTLQIDYHRVKPVDTEIIDGEGHLMNLIQGQLVNL